MSVTFLHCKVTIFPPFPYLTLWKEVTACNLHIRSGELGFTSLGGSMYINYVEFFCMGDLSVLSHLFIYLFNQTVIPITICSWIIFYNQCNVVYFVAQIVSALAIRSSFTWLLCLFDILLSLCPTLFYFVLCPVFLTLQDLWHYKTIWAHLLQSLPQS